ncbi:unnamed protein product [Closterium sp. NIES-54]
MLLALPAPRTSRPAALRVAPCCSQRFAPYCSQRVALCCHEHCALLQPARHALLQPARRALLPCTLRPAAASVSRPTAASASRSAAATRRTLLQPARRALLPCASCPAAASASRPTAASASRSTAPRIAPYCSQRVALCCPTRRALLPCIARPAATTAAAAAARTTAAAGGGAAGSAGSVASAGGAGGATGSAGGAAGAGAARGGQRRSLPLPYDPPPQQLRELVLQRARPGGGGFGFLRTAQRWQQSHQETFSPQVLSELFPQRCVTGSVEATALGASVSATALGASESAAPLGASEFAAALGARASPATGPSSAEALHTFTLDSGASRCFFRDCTTLTPLAAPVPVSRADPTGGPVVAQASTVLPCPAVPSGSLLGLHLPTFSTNLVSNTAIQDVWVDTFIPGEQRVAICMVAASSQVSASGQLTASCSCLVLSHQTLLWHHRLSHPSLPRLRGMHSRLLVSGLPRSLPSLPCSPAPPCLPYVEGLERAAPHSSEFPLTTTPLQTLHMDVWGPSPVGGANQERYFLLERTWSLNLCPRISEPETSPTLRWTGRVGDASVFRVWGTLSLVRDAKASKLSSRTLRCFLLGFPTDAPPWQFYHPRSCRVFSSQDVTFDESVCYYRLHPHASHLVPLAPLFLGLAPSGVSQVDPPPLVEPLEISSDSSGLSEGGDPAADDTAATRRSPHLETPPAETAGVEPGGAETEGEVSGGAATGGAGSGAAATRGAGSWGATTGGADFGDLASPSGGGAVGDPVGGPRAGQPPQSDLLETLSPQAICAWIVRRGSPGDRGCSPAGARAASPGGTAGDRGTGGTAGGATSAGGTRGSAGAGGAGATIPTGAIGAGGARPTSPGGTAGAGGAGGAAGAGDTGAGGTGGAGAAGPGGATGVAGGGGTGGTAGARGAGAARAGGTTSAGGARGATGAADSGGAGGTAGAGGARARGTGGTGGAGAARASGGVGAGGAGGATGASGPGGAGGTTGARGPGAARASGAAGPGGAGGAAGAASAGGAGAAGAGGTGAASTAPRRLFFYPQPQSSLQPPDSVLRQVFSLPSSTSLPLPLLCPPTDLSQPQLLPCSPLPTPAPHTEVTESLTEHREPETCASTPVRARRVAHPRPPAVPGTHGMALRPSSVPHRVVLPEPPASSLPHVPDLESDLARAASPTVTRLLVTVVNDPDLESTAAFALVSKLVDFAARSRLDYVASLVTESESVSPPSVGGEPALSSDVLEDRHFELECLGAALPRFASMLLSPTGDPDALDIPTPRSYAEAITDEYSS